MAYTSAASMYVSADYATPKRLYETRYYDAMDSPGSASSNYSPNGLSDYGGYSSGPSSAGTRPRSAGSSYRKAYDTGASLTPIPSGSRTPRMTSWRADQTRTSLSWEQEASAAPPVKRDLSLELSRSADRYSSRSNLSALHPSNTASGAAVGQRPTSTSLSSYGGAARPQPSSYSYRTPSRSEEAQHIQRRYTPQASPSPTTTSSSYTNRNRAYAGPGSPTRRRPPSMVKDAHSLFLPRQLQHHANKIVVVLDLDETLVYARDGPINVRPGTRDLLDTLHDKAEVVVWTAGERDYAQNVIEKIDPNATIHHCVYRHPKWWTGRPGYSKPLSSLGRRLDRVVLVDNTPDCLKDDPNNSILVPDYIGRSDQIMYDLCRVMEALISAPPHCTVPDILYECPEIVRRRVPLDSGGTFEVWTLRSGGNDFSPGRNRDLPARNTTRTSYW